MNPIRRRVVVLGSVQGVGYRWAAEREAAKLGVAGTIRNRFDGAVEAEIEGLADAVESMVAWMRVGPASARVDHITVSDVDARGDTAFRITG